MTSVIAHMIAYFTCGVIHRAVCTPLRHSLRRICTFLPDFQSSTFPYPNHNNVDWHLPTSSLYLQLFLLSKLHHATQHWEVLDSCLGCHGAQMCLQQMHVILTDMQQTQKKSEERILIHITYALLPNQKKSTHSHYSFTFVTRYPLGIVFLTHLDDVLRHRIPPESFPWPWRKICE